MATTHYSEQPVNGPPAPQRSYLILWKPSYHVTYVGETQPHHILNQLLGKKLVETEHHVLMICELPPILWVTRTNSSMSRAPPASQLLCKLSGSGFCYYRYCVISPRLAIKISLTLGLSETSSNGSLNIY